jgi:hypothetical protein
MQPFVDLEKFEVPLLSSWHRRAGLSKEVHLGTKVFKIWSDEKGDGT